MTRWPIVKPIPDVDAEVPTYRLRLTPSEIRSLPVGGKYSDLLGLFPEADDEFLKCIMDVRKGRHRVPPT